MGMLSGVIFDFDGVIVDTEPLHYQAFQLVMKDEGWCCSWSDYVSTYIGYDDRDAFREIYRSLERPLSNTALQQLIDAKAQAFCQVAGETHPSAFPGVETLLRELTGTIPLGLCSGALRSDIDPIVAGLGLDGVFDVMVTAEEVSRSKPDPESYQLVVNRLSQAFPEKPIEAGTCIAIEDTPAGIASARAAGLSVMAVANSYAVEELAEANCAVTSLEGITPSQLEECLVS